MRVQTAAAAMTVIRRPFTSASREFKKSRNHLESFLRYIRTPEITYFVELDPDFRHSISCYASVLKALRTHGTTFQLDKAITNMTFECKSVQECLFVVDFWRQHSEAYSYQPKYRLTRKCYDSLLYQLADFGLAGEMKCLYTEMLELRVSPGANTYNRIIEGYCEVGYVVEAMQYVCKMIQAGLGLDDAYTCIVLGYCKRMDLDSAFQVFNDMPCSRNMVTYSHLIQVLCDAGKTDEALSLFARMKDDDCIDPTCDTYDAFIVRCTQSKTYDALMEGLCKKNVHKAMRLLPEMLDRRLFPSLDTFNLLIAGQCRSGNFDTAYRLLGVMDHIPNRQTHGCIIDYLCRSKRVEEARVLFDSLALVKKNVTMYNSLIDGYCKAGKLDDARVLFEEMESDGCCFPPDSCTFTALIHGLCNDGDLKEALSMVEKMARMGLQPTVCTRTILIRQMLKQGCFDEARTCFNDMLSPDAQTYNAFVEAYCSAGRVQEAEDMMVKMKADGVPPDVFTYTLLIKAYGHVGMTCSAFHVLKRMSDAACEPSHHTFLALIKHLATGVVWKMMEFDVVAQLLEKMVDHGCTPDASCYEKLIFGMCEVGNLGIAQTLLEEMETRGMPLPPSEMVSNALLGCCCKLQKHEEAAKVVENMICSGQSPELEYCKRVILNLYRGGAKERGRSVFKKLLRCGYYYDDEIAWKILIDGVLKEEHVDADAFSEMFQAMQEHGCKFCPQTHQSLIQGKTDPAKAVAPYTSDLFTFGTEFYSL
uniref:Pentatricopeptide repeat-containing protein n=1 Tax=Noccaea caerulescens TaxID=107243 RepID=A0A1J3GJM1_NOCCA